MRVWWTFHLFFLGTRSPDPVNMDKSCLSLGVFPECPSPALQLITASRVALHLGVSAGSPPLDHEFPGRGAGSWMFLSSLPIPSLRPGAANLSSHCSACTVDKDRDVRRPQPAGRVCWFSWLLPALSSPPIHSLTSWEPTVFSAHPSTS